MGFYTPKIGTNQKVGHDLRLFIGNPGFPIRLFTKIF
jgi:hypothetical protein